MNIFERQRENWRLSNSTNTLKILDLSIKNSGWVFLLPDVTNNVDRLCSSDGANESFGKTSNLWCWNEKSLRNDHRQSVLRTFLSIASTDLSCRSDEHSRVKLTELPGDPLSSYINANYVHGWPNDSHAFIATQGPLANTIVDFYRMLWQENVSIIVMITRLFEKNKVSKGDRALARWHFISLGQMWTIFTRFSVESVRSIFCASRLGEVLHRLRSSTFDDRGEKILRLTVLSFRNVFFPIQFENEQREVEHFWYTGTFSRCWSRLVRHDFRLAWPDQSCPEVAQPLIEMVENVERSRSLSSGPVVVHCRWERDFLVEHLFSTQFEKNKYHESPWDSNEKENRRSVRDAVIILFENSPQNISIDVT